MTDENFWKDFFEKAEKETAAEREGAQRIETEVIGFNLFGHPYNKKYPPDEKKHGTEFYGYQSPYAAVLFYDFAVQHYDLEFSYRIKTYYCVSEPDHVALCDKNFSIHYQRFDNANVFIETFEIEGHKLIDIIDDLDYAEPM